LKAPVKWARAFNLMLTLEYAAGTSVGGLGVQSERGG
jgi:hypothetical protein